MLNQSDSKTAFNIVAHADDWQLFMQPNGYRALMDSANKIIFIITTAGDVGLGDVYWKAREEGLKSSLRFCMASLGPIQESNGIKEFNGHCIHCWSVNHATCYFLRLPDGNLDGNGFSSLQFQSLAKLKTAQLNTLTAVDNSTTYESWSDFYYTLQMVIHSETIG